MRELLPFARVFKAPARPLPAGTLPPRWWEADDDDDDDVRPTGERGVGERRLAGNMREGAGMEAAARSLLPLPPSPPHLPARSHVPHSRGLHVRSSSRVPKTRGLLCRGRDRERGNKTGRVAVEGGRRREGKVDLSHRTSPLAAAAPRRARRSGLADKQTREGGR